MGDLEGWLQVDGDQVDGDQAGAAERALGLGWLAGQALQVALGVALGVAALLVVVWARGILVKVVEAHFRIAGRRVGRRVWFQSDSNKRAGFWCRIGLRYLSPVSVVKIHDAIMTGTHLHCD